MAEKIVVITGPTATGKTRLSVELAKKFGGEIVSADSMQIYRGMDIGTAKVTHTEMQGVTHHMIDIADPTEVYSVSRYVEDANKAVQDILARGRLPIIAGGTNLYIDSLISGLDFAERAEDNALRERLNAQYDELGGEAMIATLRGFDPERAAKLHPADKRRIVRAIEIYTLTGETITAHDERTKLLPPRYASRRFALTWKRRETLYERIRQRVDDMMTAGLAEEVERLLQSGLSEKSTAMQAIGYKEIAAALRGECTMADAVETVKRESCRYAKRQLTWLRRDRELVWLPREDYPTEDSLLAAVLGAKP